MELRGVLESSDVARDQGEDRRAAGGVDGGRPGALRAGLVVQQPSDGANGGVRRPRDDEVVEDAEYEVVDE